MEDPTKQKSVLPLTNGTYYLPLRQDFIALCEACEKDEKSHASPYCMALILAVMEKWTNEKKKAQANLYVTMTYAQWESEIYGIFKRNTIIDSLQVLVSNKLLCREAFKRAGGGKDQYKYLLNIEIIKNLLAATFKNQLCQSPKTNDQSSISNDATPEKGLRGELNSSSAKFEIGRFKEKTSHYTESNKEDDTSSLHPFWILWCKSRSPEKDGEVTTLNAKNLGYCKKLDLICQQQNREISIELIQACEKWACEKYGYEEYWLGNLVRDLPKYLKSQVAVVETSCQELSEMPELTEEELDEVVLWTEKPSFRDHLISIGDTSVESHFDILSKMSRRDARAYYYDYPESKHYTKEEIAKFDRHQAEKQAMTRELAIAG